MVHTQQHPNSGQLFRIKFSGDIRAIQDVYLQSKVVRLDDWADRLEQSDLTAKQIEVLLSFYAHRCIPDLDPEAEISLLALNLDGLVYGTVTETLGRRFVERVVLCETELGEI